MKEEKDYKDTFSPRLEPEKLQELINRWDSDDGDEEYTREELTEIMRLEGRKRMQIVEEAKKLQREMDEGEK